MLLKITTFVLLALCVLALGGCVLANRFYQAPALEPVALTPAPNGLNRAGDEISVLTWNIGYGGMGRESDFHLDLGTQKRPLDGALVDKNMAGILALLDGLDPDIALIQEAARPSWMTYGRTVLDPVKRHFDGYASTFGADIDIRFIPPPFNVQIGNASFTRLGPAVAERRALPLEPTFALGFVRKGYRMHILRLDGDRAWTVINIHLSTFDSAEDDVRGKQVAALLDFAAEEYAAGRHVVIGGDWNLRLSPAAFAHETEDRFLFWIRDFPEGMVPDGWQFAVDPAHPTVRTAHKPYVAGENYTLVIDGFLVSPNIIILGTETIDQAFEFSDHNPVLARFRAAGAEGGTR